MVTNNNKVKICILTDSSCMVLGSELIPFSNIEIMPLNIISDDEITFTDEPKNHKKYKFEEAIKNKNTKTSQIAPFLIEEIVTKLLKTYEQIFYLPVAFKLSGQYNLAYPISQKLKYLNKLIVYKNNVVADVLKLLTYKLASLVQKGASIEELIKTADYYHKYSYIACIPGSLEKLIHSGRVTTLAKITTKILTFAKIKCMVEWTPNVRKIISRTLRKLIEIVAKEYKARDVAGNEDKQPMLLICLNHKCDKKRKLIIKNVLEKIKIPFKFTVCPLIFIAHTGFDSIGLFIVEKSITQY